MIILTSGTSWSTNAGGSLSPTAVFESIVDEHHCLYAGRPTAVEVSACKIGMFECFDTQIDTPAPQLNSVIQNGDDTGIHFWPASGYWETACADFQWWMTLQWAQWHNSCNAKQFVVAKAFVKDPLVV